MDIAACFDCKPCFAVQKMVCIYAQNSLHQILNNYTTLLAYHFIATCFSSRSSNIKPVEPITRGFAEVSLCVVGTMIHL